MSSSAAQEALNLIREMNIMSDDDQQSLKTVFSERVNEELVGSFILGKEETVARALYKTVTSTHNPSTLGFVLRLLADLCQLAPSLAKALANPASEASFGSEPAGAFMLMVSTHARDGGIANPALYLAASVLRYSPQGIRTGPATKFIAHCTQVLTNNNLFPSDVEFTVHALSVFVRRKDLRADFQKAGLVKQMARILSDACAGDSAQVIQLTYECLLTVWILSFDYLCLVDLHKSKIIPTVHRVMQRVNKEKCIRMSVMILQNFCNAQKKYYKATQEGEWAESTIYVLGEVGSGKGPAFFSDMIGIGIMKTLWQLVRRKFGDEDILVALEDLSHVLEMNLDTLTSFTEYKGEVQSGVLEWSPVHSSTKFWKENATKFEENQYEVLRELGDLIAHSRNELTLAVACHDIGELVRFHPSGRLLLQTSQLSGVKEKIMGLMSHSNPEVAKHALLAVQKIMVQKWEFIK